MKTTAMMISMLALGLSVTSFAAGTAAPAPAHPAATHASAAAPTGKKDATKMCLKEGKKRGTEEFNECLKKNM